MNDNLIYFIIAFAAFIAYKKYTQYKVLKLVPELLSQGAQIIDVRSVEEFTSAHKVGTINIPLDSINTRISEFDKTKPIILCCASGGRSAFAKRTFISNGFTSVHNVGTWRSL